MSGEENCLAAASWSMPDNQPTILPYIMAIVREAVDIYAKEQCKKISITFTEGKKERTKEEKKERKKERKKKERRKEFYCKTGTVSANVASVCLTR